MSTVHSSNYHFKTTIYTSLEHHSPRVPPPGTPITAVVNPDNQVPIRVFFINTDGILADIFQDVYGGAWANGSLIDRRFRPRMLSPTSKSLSASWCSGEPLILFVEGKDGKINAFQLSENKTSSAWSLIPGSYGDTSTSDTFASVCGFPTGLSVPPVFVSSYDGLEATGHLYAWWNNST